MGDARPNLPPDMERAHRKWKREQAKKRASEKRQPRADVSPVVTGGVYQGYGSGGRW